MHPFRGTRQRRVEPFKLKRQDIQIRCYKQQYNNNGKPYRILHLLELPKGMLAIHKAA